MTRERGATASIWAREPIPQFPTLGGDVEADVCVVGAGIAGLTTALLVAEEKLSVVVIDDGPIGGGETGRTTAHLASVLDDGFQEIERLHGEHGLRLAYESQVAAIDTIEAIAREHSIDCGFRRVDGYLFLGAGESEDYLDRERDAAHRAGCRDLERLSTLEVAGRDLGACIRFGGQAQFHPLRYVAGLARAAAGAGVRIFEGAHADAVRVLGSRAQVWTGSHAVTASHVVVATNTPFVDRVVMHTKQAAYRSYAISIELQPSVAPPALYWDTEDPYHYVRQYAEGTGELLIVGGEDHKVGQDEGEAPDARFARLEAWARERFAGLGGVRDRWSGQVMEPVDGVAFIGRNPLDHPNVYVATGDSGMGMTHGTIAGILIRDLIVERNNEWEGLYDPSRKTLRAATEWLRENLNVAHEITTLVTPGDVSSVDEIARGCGAVIRRGLGKIAAYRDENDRVHERSAICPHLGCVVAWNSTEKSWDCPCHGSRFDPFGRVLNGPSVSDLSAVE